MRTNRPLRRATRNRLFAVLAALGMAVGMLSLAPAASASTVTVISPGANVLAAMLKLKAGDVLELNPGTYNTGYLRVTPMASGTGSAPITIMAADPANPPLLLGGLRFYSPNYLNLTSLRIQGTAAGLAGLTMDGGTGWDVDKVEVWGAAQTKSLANVVIMGTGGYPRQFMFSENCIHDAANVTTTPSVDHNIYVTFQGSAATSGSIIRNLIWNAPNGENIKLGDGGLAGALGPWNVRVANNTLAKAGRQILLHANVSNNVIVGNLMYVASAPFVANPQTTQIYVHDVIGTGNYVSHTYWAYSTMLSYDPLKKVTYGLGNVAGKEPAFLGAFTCNGWRPTLAAAQQYGRWGTGVWSR